MKGLSIAERPRREDPINDAARLAALHQLEIADSGVGKAIDGLSRLATRLLEVPVSLVTLVEAERQVFLGQHGLDGEIATSRETPLSHSFCRYTVQERRPLVIEDTRAERHFQDHPAIGELGVAAYAGVPLILESGDAVGAFCAIDFAPRAWSRDELEILEDLAAVTTQMLDTRAALVHQGLHDRLTGLPNRELLVASCEEFLTSLEAGERVAVLCAGVDHFNMINQAFGTEGADRVLRSVAEQLRAAVRDTDVFGRLRGDVFATIAPGIRDEAEALGLAARIHRALSSAPLDIEGEPLSVGVTLGVALGGEGAKGADLISEAANAMREAKRSQGRVRVAERDLTETAAAQLRMREALHVALDREEIEAAFQPIVALEGGQPVGYEALARWTNADLGPVGPAEFMPLAELTSDVVPIGRFMLKEAAAFASRLWRLTGEEARVTLNVSPVQLEQAGFAEEVREAFEAEGLRGRSLGIEITEGVLLESGPDEKRNLGRLREFGARILLDDFGTGYSSLGYLRDFQIDTIKIDRSFVSRLSEDRHAAALIQAILAMGRGMDMEIVAEGIETEEQAKLLRLLGCRYGQGFALGSPVSAERALAEVGRLPRAHLPY